MQKSKFRAGILAALAVSASAWVIGGCSGKNAAPLGSADNPIKMAFVPSLETGSITTNAERLAKAIEDKTGYKISVSVPVSYAAVIESMAGGHVDVAWFAPLSYVLAHDKVGAEVMLVTERDEHTNYFGIILAPKAGAVKSVKDIKGKRFAFTDPLSTSGTLYPKELLIENGIDPEKDITPMYAGGHDKAIIALYNGQADACACYGGYKQDARDRVESTIPDIKAKTVVIARTAAIPNDNVSASKNLPPDVRDKLTKALLEISGSPEGKKMLFDVADIDGLQPAKDSDYDTVRKMATKLGLNVQEVVASDKPKPKKPAPKKP